MRGGGGSDLLEDERREGCVRVHQHRDDLLPSGEFLQDLQSLALKVPSLVGEARDISAGSGETSQVNP